MSSRRQIARWFGHGRGWITMNVKTNIMEALDNLFSAKLRSFLAILGILVGTGSVVALITSSQLATEHALAQFETMGTNLLAADVQPPQSGIVSSQQQTSALTLEQMPEIQRVSPQIVEVAPYITLFQSIYFDGEAVNGGQVIGATVALADIMNIRIAKGRFVSYLDRSNPYCVIGSSIAADFAAKGVSDPLGKQIQIGDWLFTIVGVAQPWASNWFFLADVNKGVIVPLDVSYSLSQYAKINNLLFRLVPNPDIPSVQAMVLRELKKLLPNHNISFRNPEQIINIMKNQQATFTWLLGSIGGISLLVGGIGVMNIMLVSVVERRREIGIRMAVGARRSDIRRMFLMEAVVLTLFGGLLGIILGLLCAWILTEVTGWEFHFLITPPLLGFVVSVLVGIISGFYPAHRASKLDPIETLRSE